MYAIGTGCRGKSHSEGVYLGFVVVVGVHAGLVVARGDLGFVDGRSPFRSVENEKRYVQVDIHEQNPKGKQYKFSNYMYM